MQLTKTILIVLLVCFTQHLFGQSQYWALKSFRKLDLQNNQVSLIDNVAFPTPPTNPPISAAVHGLFDEYGHTIFFIQGNEVYDQSASQVGTLSVFSTQRLYPEPYAINVVPVPGSSCEYYVLYVQIEENISNSRSTYILAAQKISVDNALNVTVDPNPSTLSFLGTFSASTNINIAISREVNGERQIYTSFKRNASLTNNAPLVVQSRLNASGLIATNTGFFNSNTYSFNRTNTLELSGRYLSWIGIDYSSPSANTYKVYIRDAITNNVSAYAIAGLNQDSDLEFSAGGNLLYATTTTGLVVINSADGSISRTVTNPLYANGEIELGRIGTLYIAYNNRLDVVDAATFRPVAFLPLLEKYLPSQVSGQNVTFTRPFSVSISEGGNLQNTLQANVTGGSGNFSYQWNTPGDINYGTGATLSPCGSFTHTLTVTDLNAGGSCGTSVTINYFYASPFACPPIVIGPGPTPAQRQETQGALLYPNPTESELTINFDEEQKIQEVVVIDRTGKQLLKEVGSQRREQQISTEKLPKGLYIIQIKTEDTIIEEKFIKQ